MMDLAQTVALALHDMPTRRLLEERAVQTEGQDTTKSVVDAAASASCDVSQAFRGPVYYLRDDPNSVPLPSSQGNTRPTLASFLATVPEPIFVSASTTSAQPPRASSVPAQSPSSASSTPTIAPIRSKSHSRSYPRVPVPVYDPAADATSTTPAGTPPFVTAEPHHRLSIQAEENGPSHTTPGTSTTRGPILNQAVTPMFGPSLGGVNDYEAPPALATQGQAPGQGGRGGGGGGQQGGGGGGQQGGGGGHQGGGGGGQQGGGGNGGGGGGPGGNGDGDDNTDGNGNDGGNDGGNINGNNNNGVGGQVPRRLRRREKMRAALRKFGKKCKWLVAGKWLKRGQNANANPTAP